MKMEYDGPAQSVNVCTNSSNCGKIMEVSEVWIGYECVDDEKKISFKTKPAEDSA